MTNLDRHFPDFTRMPAPLMGIEWDDTPLLQTHFEHGDVFLVAIPLHQEEDWTYFFEQVTVNIPEDELIPEFLNTALEVWEGIPADVDFHVNLGKIDARV